LIYKSLYHGKSATDEMHNFPRQVAEKQNKQNNALNIPDLTKACEKRESELYEQLNMKTKERKRKGCFRRFFYQRPDTEKKWKPFLIPNFEGKLS
jgi:hypothetical protein